MHEATADNHNKKNKNQGVSIEMGESRQFRAGQKAPNNGVYIEIGETGGNVNDPQKVELNAGDTFPENTNHNRLWTNKRHLTRPGKPGVQ